MMLREPTTVDHDGEEGWSASLRYCFNPECPSPDSPYVRQEYRDGLAWIQCGVCSVRGPAMGFAELNGRSIREAVAKAAEAWNTLPRRGRLLPWLLATAKRFGPSGKPEDG